MDLLTPVKTTIAIARHGAGAGAGRPHDATKRVRHLVGRGGDDGPGTAGPSRTAAPPRPTEATPGTPVTRRPVSSTSAAPSSPAVPTAPAPRDIGSRDMSPDPVTEPAHIDETPPEVVRSSADAGAEDGVGANIHIDEPWEGYGAMTAADVIDRLAVADAAQLAVVRLYEPMHRDRRTVLAEVDRRLAAAG
jgi:hypothetical protein